MKILLWSQYFWPETFQINQLVTALRNQGIDITVLTGKPNYPEGALFPNYRFWGIQKEEYSGAEIIRVPLIPRKKNSPLQLTLNYLSFILFGLVCAPFLLRRKKFDVVFVYGLSPILQALPAILISRLKRVPLVTWVQDIWPEALESTGYVKNRHFLGFIRLIVRYIYQQSDMILIQSEAFRASVNALIDQPEKIYFYPNATEEAVLYPEENYLVTIPKFICKLMQEKFSIVFTGNLGKVQSWQTILDAAELLIEHTKIHFFLIGSGSMFQHAQKEAERRQLGNISFVAKLPFSHMPYIYNLASVLLISLNNNITLNTTIPSKLCGYLAAGKPIIASLNGEAARIVKEAQAGLTGAAENAEALADNILKMFFMKDTERSQFGMNAKKYFQQHFELTKCSNDLTILLKKIIPSYSQGVFE